MPVKTEMLTDEELVAIQARVEKATPGKWVVVRSEAYKNSYGSICGETEVMYFVTTDELRNDGSYIVQTRDKPLAMLVASAHQDIPRLISDLAATASENARLNGKLNAALDRITELESQIEDAGYDALERPEKITVREGHPTKHRGRLLTVKRIKGRGRRYQIVIDDQT